MDEVKLSTFYDTDRQHSHSRTAILKFALMPLVFFVTLGIPGRIGGYITTYSNFVAEVFFILYGFYTLVPNKQLRKEKLERELKRSFKFFITMFVVSVLLSILYLTLANVLGDLMRESFLRKRTIFDFLVLNIWPLPIGNTIWFVQSLVYAYVFFLVIDNLKLDKFYLPIMILSIIFMLGSGEFAAFTGFPYYGYLYIPGGAVTRAIPYMLIGMYIRKNVDMLSKIRHYYYLILFPVGLALAIAEFEILSRTHKLAYVGHVFGFGIMAISICCFAIAKPAVKNNYLSVSGGRISRKMYFYCQPVSFIIWLMCYIISPAYCVLERQFDALLSLLICYILAFLLDYMEYYRRVKGGLKKNKYWQSISMYFDGHYRRERKRQRRRRKRERLAKREEQRQQKKQ